MIILNKKWYKKILNKVTEIDTNVLLVEDKAGLLDSQDLRDAISDLYAKIIIYTNEVKLRIALRQNNDKILVILRENRYFSTDIAKKNPIIQVGYQDVFPLLDESALDWLNLNEIQELFYLYQRNIDQYDKLTHKESFNFIIKNLYDLDPIVTRQEQLVAFLIKYYFISNKLTGAVLNHLKDYKTKCEFDFNNITEKKGFYKWLNREWREFINKKSSIIDFNDLSIRYLLNDCFDQGLMKPIDVMKEKVDTDFVIKEAKENYWINVGISNLDKVDIINGFESEKSRLKDLLNRELKTRDWGSVVKGWSKLAYLNNLSDMDTSLEDIQEKMDYKFYKYIDEYYDNLAYDQRFYYAPLNNRILSHISDKKVDKLALICFDGMSFKEWPVIKEYLQDKLSISFSEEFSISMIPTVTKLSRRAIFSGKPPVEDDGVGNEERAFKRAISKKTTINEEEIFFKRENNPEYNEFLGYKAVGLIYNFVDDLSHAAQNQKMLLNNITDNLNNFELDKIIGNLLQDGFKIYFSSDHGNLYAKGNKYNPRKSLVEERAARAVVYETENLANNEEFNDKIVLKFPNIIGENYIVTMTNRKKFSNREAGFTHGGINIEEVFIPFIEVIE